MNLVITGGHSPFVRQLATALAAEHQVRLFTLTTPTTDLPGVDIQVGDVRDESAAAAACAKADALIHALGWEQGQAEPDDALTALDLAGRGSYVLLNAARAAGVQRVLVLSSLHLFARLPAHWRINEAWRPQPTPALTDLLPWLTELSVRESVRVGSMRGACLRLGEVVSPAAWPPGGEAGICPVHQNDAMQLVKRTLELETPPPWAVYHALPGGDAAHLRLSHAYVTRPPLNYEPQHSLPSQIDLPTEPDPRPWREILAAPMRIRERSIYRVVIFGAGGPMGAVTAEELASSYTLRLTDVRSLAEIQAEHKPQSPGAPLPRPFDPPHENQVVDVRDPAQVQAACRHSDAIINCTVVRHHAVDAFRVNTLGAYNIARAAVEHGIRRVVQTGPLLHSEAYFGDYDLTVDAPERPVDHLYFHSKYLGQEILRVFADYYDLEVPVLLFSSLRNPALPGRNQPPFIISWPDTGRALRRALEVTHLSSPYEQFNIGVDLPHRRYRFDKAQALLNWSPRDSLAHLWQDLAAEDDDGKS